MTVMHLYEEVSWLHFWEGHLEVLDDLDATGLIDTDGFDFRGIGHGITELVGGSCREWMASSDPISSEPSTCE
jgi:hypothetical protein